MNTIIGDLLRLKRLEKKYTLETTAKYVGVSINYISKLEKGLNSNPSDEIIVKLASTLEIDEDKLFQSFGKIPLSTRKVLEAHPSLTKALAQVNADDQISNEKKEEFLEKAIYWYKKLLEDQR
jgi:transcriptional regulator with XRE-family HTH domain